jgi:sigma-B regulation protein RsbU (phosphoserine phosphatase)
MKFFKRKQSKRAKGSIAHRLTWRVVLSMTIVFTFILLFVFLIIWAVGLGGLMYYNQSVMDTCNERINNVFSNVEVAISNNVPEVEECAGKDRRLYEAQENLLRLNSNIVGTAVAYNPDYEPKKGQPFAPYSYRDSTGIHCKQLNTEEYDYLNKDWYKKPIAQKKGLWSDPYIDKGGGDIPMITYSLPIINKRGEAYIVQTADIALDWLHKMVLNMDSMFVEKRVLIADEQENENYVPGFSFILTDEGHIVAHSRDDIHVGEPIEHYLKKNKCTFSNHLVEDLLTNNDKVFLSLKDSSGHVFMLYSAPISRSGWIVVTAFPARSVVEPVTIVIGVFLAMMIVGLIIVALVCRFAIKRLTKPITRFAESANEIAKGNFQAELPVIKSKDEMMLLHDSFKTMQTSLIQQIEEVKTVNEEKGRIESELQIARNIQMAMLPKVFPPYPDRHDIDIYGQLTPAREVGGDLYDFHIRDEKLFFCIGAVSGKGVPAALVMAVTKALFRTVSARENDPAKILTSMNNIMVEGNDSYMFVTMFIGIMDLATGHLSYSNAGHDAPILMGKEGNGYLPCDANLPLGISPGWEFTLQETVIDSKTIIFLYTDGLTEADNGNHELFKEERIFEVMEQSERQPLLLIKNMTKGVHRFVGSAEQSDDLTMLAVQYFNTKKKES